jgi:hypothetical protein
MKCHQAVETGRPLELIERETPRPRGGEVAATGSAATSPSSATMPKAPA